VVQIFLIDVVSCTFIMVETLVIWLGQKEESENIPRVSRLVGISCVLNLPANFTARDNASVDLEGRVSSSPDGSVLSAKEGEGAFFFRMLSIENGFVSMEKNCSSRTTVPLLQKTLCDRRFGNYALSATVISMHETTTCVLSITCLLTISCSCKCN